MKVAILLLALLAAPYALYYGYTLWARRRALETGRTPPPFGAGPMGWLAIVGLSLCVALFVALAVFGESIMGDSPPGGSYVPPRFEGGVIVPGHTIPAPKPGGSQ